VGHLVLLLARLRGDADVSILGVGGNDALGHIDILAIALFGRPG
jgi:hypothetical protein